MVTISSLQTALDAGQFLEYQCLANLNLYDSPNLQGLATQAVAGRQLVLCPLPSEQQSPIQGTALLVRLCEDDYPGWLPLEDLDLIEVADVIYRAIALPTAEIQSRLPQVIAFAHRAMAQPNHYLWGGTVGPNYDCSGLVQTAFASAGIWIPRDAYQQAAFVEPIDPDARQLGDLIFFGRSEKITHVGLYLGDGYYIHSSGRDMGRNGIGIDRLTDAGDIVSQRYHQQYCGTGRVVACYQPQTCRTSVP